MRTEPNLLISEHGSDSPSEPAVVSSLVPPTPAWLTYLTKLYLIAMIVFFPILFGGVHPQTYLSAYGFSFLLLACWIIFVPNAFRALFSKYRSFTLVCKAIAVFLFYLLIQYAVLSWRTDFHPVLGAAPITLSPGKFWDGFQAVCFFGSFFVLIMVTLVSLQNSKRFLAKLVLSNLGLVCLIALSHWFYDNGRLFWVLEPDYVFVSQRARWPFVNPNHLADFLLPAAFLVTSLLVIAVSAITQPFTHSAKRAPKIHELLHSSKLHSQLRFLVTCSILMLMLVLSITATLSRAAGGALLCGLAVLMLLRFRVKTTQPLIESVPASTNAKRRRRSSTRNLTKEIQRRIGLNTLLRWSGGIVLACLALIFIFFLVSGDSLDLIEERIEYGLLNSKDDIRWELLSNSLILLRQNYMFGIGLGSWSDIYPRYMSPLLSGISPGYLHMDPLQFLIEVGIIGLVPFLLLFVWITVRSVKLARCPGPTAQLVAGIYLGLCSLLLAAAFDFPFRIPAVLAVFAGYLAYLCYMLDSAGSES